MTAQRSVRERLARSSLGACLAVFCVAFGVRAYLLTKIPDHYILPHTRYEITAVAMSLCEKGEFADPYAIPTGPTAHTPPFYPLWLALLYRTFGTSMRAGYIQWLFDIAFDATMFAMLPWLARRFGLGLRAGLLGGFAGAVLPRWLSSVEALAAIALGLLLAAFAERWARRATTIPRSVLLGAASGIALHITPSLLPVILGCVAFEVVWMPGRRGRWSGAAILLGMAIAVAPWTWRNWVTFHEIYVIRGNLGLELRVGNHDGAHADVDVSDERRRIRHPRTDVDEAMRVRELGEAEYMRRAGAEAIAWIRAHPSEYARLVAARFVYFWTGPIYRPVAGTIYLALLALAALGAAMRVPALPIPQRAALLIPLVTFPITYYFVSWMPRYRIPIEWILVLFAGSGLAILLGERRGAAPEERRVR